MESSNNTTKQFYKIYEDLYKTDNPFFQDKFLGVQGIFFYDDALHSINQILRKHEIQIYLDNKDDLILENQNILLLDDWKSIKTRQIKCYPIEKYITILMEDILYANYVGGAPHQQLKCYHIDLETGKILTNQSFLTLLGMSTNDIQNNIINELNSEEKIYFQETESNDINQQLGAIISDESCIFIDENGNFNMYVTITVLGSGFKQHLITLD